MYRRRACCVYCCVVFSNIVRCCILYAFPHIQRVVGEVEKSERERERDKDSTLHGISSLLLSAPCYLPECCWFMQCLLKCFTTELLHCIYMCV